ncbi:hypothetical protein [Flavobacterium gilvum]|uniref:Uncharacterized protein n=1 Tax=Flavobacterium gilvum TaxID=1492737 RepID=A0AAC9I522_9FLAO|nr:hypothetical protein [Flavobacterium gilvum]AOW09018.1 hypothetical protein EM308_05565 [Flavobacterium gilvum]
MRSSWLLLFSFLFGHAFGQQPTALAPLGFIESNSSISSKLFFICQTIKTFVIQTISLAGKDNTYIQSGTLNGKQITKTKLFKQE